MLDFAYDDVQAHCPVRGQPRHSGALDKVYGVGELVRELKTGHRRKWDSGHVGFSERSRRNGMAPGDHRTSQDRALDFPPG